MSICGRADLARPTIWISFVDKALWSSNLPTASRGPVGERSPKSTFGGRGEVSEVGASQLPEWRDKGDELPLPRSIGSIYRALRRRPEDSKDEPGAADFYSGGMEMRRAARPERIILWLYRLVSGYGLRASRALGALLITVAVFSFGLWWFGFDPPHPDYARALLVGVESTSSLFRVPDTPGLALTYGGEAL
jgi:hypothetical protein